MDKEKEKEANTLSPLARQTVRDAIQMFRGGMLSLMQFATVQVRASAGVYPEPVQVISECGADVGFSPPVIRIGYQMTFLSNNWQVVVPKEI